MRSTKASRAWPRVRATAALFALAVALGALQAGTAGATETNIGGGAADGTWKYDSPGVPQAFADCQAVDFQFGSPSTANLIINVQTEGPGTGFDGFAGQVTLQ